MEELKIGSHVVFQDMVYQPPYSPYYDPYKGHVFEILAFHYENSHVELRCIDINLRVAGYVHPDELRLADNCGLCWGAKGGIRGNENKINGLVLCDYCSSAFSK